MAAFRVQLARCATRKDLLAAVAKALNFPDWFGHNFDALADCLADMCWQPADGYLVMLEHCDEIHGTARGGLRQRCTSSSSRRGFWREEGLPFWCLVEMQADGIAWLPGTP